jgi:hypothetical protein
MKNPQSLSLGARVIAALVVEAVASVAFAQDVDFSGAWMPLYHEDGPERLPGPELGDYTGIPVNDAARLRADSYDADRISVVTEYQCRQHSADYSMRGLATLRIDSEVDAATQHLIAFHTRIGFQAMERAIWLDGRSHPPPEAAHSWQGFSTGVWNGNVLTITTTHLKAYYLRNRLDVQPVVGCAVAQRIQHRDRELLEQRIDDRKSRQQRRRAAEHLLGGVFVDGLAQIQLQDLGVARVLPVRARVAGGHAETAGPDQRPLGTLAPELTADVRRPCEVVDQ